MACCIFAAMIISNVLVHWRRLKAFFGYCTGTNPGLVTDSALSNKDRSLRYRIRRAFIPTLLIIGTLAYGTQHWQHMGHELGLSKHHAVTGAEVECDETDPTAAPNHKLTSYIPSR